MFDYEQDMAEISGEYLMSKRNFKRKRLEKQNNCFRIERIKEKSLSRRAG